MPTSTYFVDYTVATAKHDKAGQKKAVANLMAYIQTQAAFFAKATGLPKQTLVDDLTAHVLQLKGQLDAFARGNYAQAYALTNGAYEHMGMTADLLAGAIAKQKHLGSISSPGGRPRGRLDRLLGEHALLATWATQAGLNGGQELPGARQAARRELGRDLEGDRLGVRRGRREAVPERQPNLWRAHIKDFVAYTVATAKHDKAGQKKAVADLMAYIQTQAAFFAKATGLPKQALVNDLTAHVLQLKGALDDYSAKRYGATFTLVNGAYDHMFMTGSVLAGGIAKQKGLK